MNLSKYFQINYFLFFIESRFLKRRTPVTFSINNNSINATDALAAFWQFKEIFIDESYFFISDKSSPIIIDCGANIGLSTLYFKNIYPNAIIYAFEPNSKIFNILIKNLANYKDITLSSSACWTSDGELDFYIGPDDGSSITKASESIIKVKSLSLNNFLNSFNSIDFLKMDIEGAEKIVFPSIEKNLHKISNLFIEYHCWENELLNLSEICKILEQNNFRYTIERTSRECKPLTTLKNESSVQLNIFASNLGLVK